MNFKNQFLIAGETAEDLEGSGLTYIQTILVDTRAGPRTIDIGDLLTANLCRGSILTVKDQYGSAWKNNITVKLGDHLVHTCATGLFDEYLGNPPDNSHVINIQFGVMLLNVPEIFDPLRWKYNASGRFKVRERFDK